MGLATAVTLASLGMSAYQGIKGAQAEAAANQAAENAANQAARIAEADKFQSLQVPTLGLELAQQNIQAQQAQGLQGLRDIGAAGVLGGLTGLGQQSRAQNLELAADAQQLQYQRDLAQAQNAQQIEQGRMQREFAMNQAKLAGAQTAAAEARQNKATAIQGAMSALSNAATLGAYKDIYGNQEENKGPGFLAQLGYSLGLGGTNDTPVSTTMVNAQEAFKPTIQGMAPSNVNMTNTGINKINANMQVPDYMGSLRAAQGQYDASQLAGIRAGQGQFDLNYQFDPYNYRWTKK